MRSIVRSRSIRWLLILQILFLSFTIAQENVLPPCEQAELDFKNGVERTQGMVKAIYPEVEDLRSYYKCYYLFVRGEELKVEPSINESFTNEQYLLACCVILGVIVVIGIIDFARRPINISLEGDPF